jgi:hypothetical protein
MWDSLRLTAPTAHKSKLTRYASFPLRLGMIGKHPEFPDSAPADRLPADVLLRQEPDEEEDEDEDEGDGKKEPDDDEEEDDGEDDGYSE